MNQPSPKYQRALVALEISMPEHWEASGGRESLIKAIEALFGMRVNEDYDSTGVGPHDTVLHGIFLKTWVPRTVDGDAADEKLMRQRLEYPLVPSQAWKEAIAAAREEGMKAAQSALEKALETPLGGADKPKVIGETSAPYFHLEPLTQAEHNGYDSREDTAPWCEREHCPVEHRDSAPCPERAMRGVVGDPDGE